MPLSVIGEASNHLAIGSSRSSSSERTLPGASHLPLDVQVPPPCSPLSTAQAAPVMTRTSATERDVSRSIAPLSSGPRGRGLGGARVAPGGTPAGARGYDGAASLLAGGSTRS